LGSSVGVDGHSAQSAVDTLGPRLATRLYKCTMYTYTLHGCNTTSITTSLLSCRVCSSSHYVDYALSFPHCRRAGKTLCRACQWQEPEHFSRQLQFYGSSPSVSEFLPCIDGAESLLYDTLYDHCAVSSTGVAFPPASGLGLWARRPRTPGRLPVLA
jgi:hypothetical protein